MLGKVDISVNFYAIPSLLTTIIFLLLIGYSVLRLRNNEIRNLSLIIMITLIWWSTGEAVMRLTTDEGIALIASHILISIGSVFIGVVTLHFTLVLTGHFKDIKDSSIYVGFYTLPIFVTVIRASTNAVVVGVKLEYWGYTEVQSDLGGMIYGIMIVVTFFMSFYVLIQHLRTVEGKTQRAYKLLLAGFMIPLAIGFTTDTLLPILGVKLPEMAMTATLIYATMLIIAIKDIDAFEIIPVKEQWKDGKELEKASFDLRPGKIYYLDEPRGEVSLKAFVSSIHSGHPGLAVVRMSPKKFREVTGLEKTPIIWLASQEVPEEHIINPSAIPRISSAITEFLTSGKEPVIYLEGLETLVFINNFREIMGFMSFIYERISISEGIMIVPISRSTMVEPEWAMLTRQMEDLSLAMMSNKGIPDKGLERSQGPRSDPHRTSEPVQGQLLKRHQA